MRQFPALVLTGARQTGKTTLLRSLFPAHHSVSLDLPSAAIVRGGFPDLWRDPGIDANAYYRAYLSTYLERDVRQILNVAARATSSAF